MSSEDKELKKIDHVKSYMRSIKNKGMTKWQRLRHALHLYHLNFEMDSCNGFCLLSGYLRNSVTKEEKMNEEGADWCKSEKECCYAYKLRARVERIKKNA